MENINPKKSSLLRQNTSTNRKYLVAFLHQTGFKFKVSSELVSSLPKIFQFVFLEICRELELLCSIPGQFTALTLSILSPLSLKFVAGLFEMFLLPHPKIIYD